LGISEKSTLMITLARCGEHRRAAELAAEVRMVGNASILVTAVSTTYGICMATVQGDRKLDQLGSEERRLRDHYRDLAMASLKEGVAKGYATLIYIERDPDFEPLHELPEFKAWLAEFKKTLNRN